MLKLVTVIALFSGFGSSCAAFAAADLSPADAALVIAYLIEGRVMRVSGTHSMEPALNATDLVVVEPISLAELELNDIVVFFRRAQLRPIPTPAMLVAHRIVRIEDAFVVTQGDHPELNAKEDPDKPGARAVRGRVAFAIDGETGLIRDMRTARAGSPVTLNAILADETVVAAASRPGSAYPSAARPR